VGVGSVTLFFDNFVPVSPVTASLSKTAVDNNKDTYIRIASRYRDRLTSTSQYCKRGTTK
jgi:hypothetical protein